MIHLYKRYLSSVDGLVKAEINKEIVLSWSGIFGLWRGFQQLIINNKNIIAETKRNPKTEVLGVTINSIQTKGTIFREFNSIEEISPVNLNRIWGRKLGVTICSIIS